MKTLFKAGLVVLLGITAAFAGSIKSKTKSTEARVLTAGAYSAQVKGIVCGGCGSFIQQTLEKIGGIEAVSVNQDKKTVQFQIKKDAKVKLAEVQKALQASAAKMGMGADYLLRDLKKVS
jgi:copper chaperone CopZ